MSFGFAVAAICIIRLLEMRRAAGWPGAFLKRSNPGSAPTRYKTKSGSRLVLDAVFSEHPRFKDINSHSGNAGKYARGHKHE